MAESEKELTTFFLYEGEQEESEKPGLKQYSKN